MATRIANREQLLMIFGSDTIVSVPPIRIFHFPLEGRTHGDTGNLCCIEKFHGLSYDRGLHVAIPRMSARISEWKVGEQEARYTTVFDDVEG